MTVKRLKIRNFKSLANCELDLKGLNVLVGPNSSGKSSIIQVLRLLAHAAQSDVPGADLPLNATTFKFGTFDQICSHFPSDHQGVDGEDGHMGVTLGIEVSEPIDRTGRRSRLLRDQNLARSCYVQLKLDKRDPRSDARTIGPSVANTRASGSANIRSVTAELSDERGRMPNPQKWSGRHTFERISVEEAEDLYGQWARSQAEEESRPRSADEIGEEGSWTRPSSASDIPEKLFESALYKLVKPESTSTEASGSAATYAELSGCVPREVLSIGTPTLDELDAFLRRLVRFLLNASRRGFDSETRARLKADEILIRGLLAEDSDNALFSHLPEDRVEEEPWDLLAGLDLEEWGATVDEVSQLFREYWETSRLFFRRDISATLGRFLFSQPGELDIDQFAKILQRLRSDCWRDTKKAPGPMWSTPSPMRGRVSGLSEAGEIWKQTMGRVIYMSGLRNEPRVIDDYQDMTLALAPLGSKGEYASSILLDESERKIRCPSPDGNDFVLEEMSLKEGVAQWLNRFGIARESRSDALENIGVQTKLVDNQTGLPLDLTYLGVGASQLLPIIVLCLRAGDNDVILLEQPEIHLHPGAQQILGDFLLGITSRGTQVVVETHSEYLVNRLRLRMIEVGLGEQSRIADQAKSTVASDQVAIWFCERHEGRTSVTELQPTPDGSFTVWPEGFFDQGPLEAERILMAAMRGLHGSATEKPELDS